MTQDNYSFGRIAAAWCVHVYTAFGVVLGFLALNAAFSQDYATTFLFLTIALLVDSTDGMFARALEVRKVIPWFDGSMLDNLVDYFTYVIVPVAVFVQPGILPPGTEHLALTVLLASAYGFSRTDAKGFVDHYFLGFPSYWNIMAFYFVVLGSAPWVNLTAMLIAAVLVFVPMRWLYPSRSEVLRAPTLILGALWGMLNLYMLAHLPDPSPRVAMLSLFYPVYYTVCSVIFHFRY